MKSGLTEKSRTKKRAAGKSKTHKTKPIKLRVPRTHKPDNLSLEEWQQRIKNWKTRTAQYVKKLESTFAMVLTGTGRQVATTMRGKRAWNKWNLYNMNYDPR